MRKVGITCIQGGTVKAKMGNYVSRKGAIYISVCDKQGARFAPGSYVHFNEHNVLDITLQIPLYLMHL